MGDKLETKRMLDLFSGLGGASEAFLDHGWEVKRVENNPELSLVPNTEIIDVQSVETMLKLGRQIGFTILPVDFVWASPPCTDFSNGYESPKSRALRAGENYNPESAIELVKCTKRIIDMLNPRFWIIENVAGSVEYLEPILGKPRLIIDSIYLWGNFPLWAMEPGYKHVKDDSAWSSNPLRANIRAKIPYAVSDACRQSIENTKTLDYWF
jgi:hypothetical protein